MNSQRHVLRHPYLDHEPDTPLSKCSIVDALNASAATLLLLADLFVAPADKSEILTCDSSRLGMFNQLTTIANTLEVLSDRICTNNEEVTHEISIPLSDDELSCLTTFAAQGGMTADELMSKIVKARLKDWPLA
ncbi:MAG: hypothetical protein HC889_06005 [Synechococcaceae cyanobacterium SM1_2_3]|nr:hypothetical protein [Synechococcaceae cyanobacterium SM1_2_3]